MLTAAQSREQATAAGHVSEFMRKHKLSIADLIEIGGEDLKSPDRKCAHKVRRVADAWKLIAQLGISYVVLENALVAGGAA
jgi:hypothetical protein